MTRLDALICSGRSGGPLKPPVRDALPIRLDPEGATEAVLLIHGFSGYPGELGAIARGLAAAGYAVAAPRLPGHGTSRRDFLQVAAEDWARHAYDAYLDLKAEYDTVHVGGHSMGALLAAAIAASFGAPKLILMAPAFELSVRFMGLTPLASLFLRVLKANRPLSSADAADPTRAALQPEYWADVMVSPAGELQRLRGRCRRALRDVRSRVLVVAGAEDRTVPVGVVDYVERTAANAAAVESRILPGAGHVFIFDGNAEAAGRIVCEWMVKSRAI
jgi:carboxylesterase